MILRNKKTGEIWDLVYRYKGELPQDWELYNQAEPTDGIEKRVFVRLELIKEVILELPPDDKEELLRLLIKNMTPHLDEV